MIQMAMVDKVAILCVLIKTLVVLKWSDAVSTKSGCFVT